MAQKKECALWSQTPPAARRPPLFVVASFQLPVLCSVVCATSSRQSPFPPLAGRQSRQQSEGCSSRQSPVVASRDSSGDTCEGEGRWAEWGEVEGGEGRRRGIEHTRHCRQGDLAEEQRK
jgi:hypothetical protein